MATMDERKKRMDGEDEACDTRNEYPQCPHTFTSDEVRDHFEYIRRVNLCQAVSFNSINFALAAIGIWLSFDLLGVLEPGWQHAVCLASFGSFVVSALQLLVSIYMSLRLTSDVVSGEVGPWWTEETKALLKVRNRRIIRHAVESMILLGFGFVALIYAGVKVAAP
jgi:hypothetical protein